MKATQRQTEPIAVLEALEQRTLLSGDVMAGALVAEPLIPGSDLNNVAIIAGPSGDNTSTVGQSEQGFLGSGNETDSSIFPFPGPIVNFPSVQHYMLDDHWGGEWLDAEKSPSPDDDDLMCWAAATANVLDWTGWGQVNGMTNTDQMFQYFQDHWTNKGGRPNFGWDWWFDGTNDGPAEPGWSHVDVKGGGFYPNETFADYYHYENLTSDAMVAIDAFQHAGYGTAVGLKNPGEYYHAVTAWGYSYSSSDPTDYKGIWLTDSDDNKHTASPPNELRYYEVYFKGDNPGGRWFLKDYYGSDGYSIDKVWALEQNPNHRADLYNAGDAWSWFGPDTVNSGQPWEAHFDIRNDSTVGAGQFYVDFYASNDATITSGDHFLGRVDISSLAGGAKANADLVLANFPLSLATGSYHVGIIIDSTDNVDEFDEANNTGTDDSLLHVANPIQARLDDSTRWVEWDPVGPMIPGTNLPGVEYFPTFHDPASTLSLDSAAEPTMFNEYLPGTEDNNTLGLDGGMDTLGVWDSTLRTDAEFYTDGTADLTRTLDSSSQTATLFDGDAGDGWNTSDLGVQNVFAGVSALELFTFELEL